MVELAGLAYHTQECGLYHALSDKEQLWNYKQRLEQTCVLERLCGAALDGQQDTDFLSVLTISKVRRSWAFWIYTVYQS